MGRIRTTLQSLSGTLQRRLRRIEPSSFTPFHGDMRIDAAWHHHPSTPTVFARYHLPACDGCAVRFDETLSEACAAYGLDLDAFVKELNALRPKTTL